MAKAATAAAASGAAKDLERTETAGEGDLTANEREILAALVELDAQNDVRWTVTRVGARDQAENGYCGTLTSVELTMETIAQSWGPGQYRVQGNRSNGSYVKMATVRISKSAKIVSASSTPTGSPSIADQIALMREEREASNARMLQWVTALSPLVAAVIGRPAQPMPTMTDMATVFATLKDAATPKGSQLDDVLKVISVAKELGGDGGSKETSVADLIGDAIKTLPALLGARGASMGGAAPLALPSPTAAPEGLAPLPSAPTTVIAHNDVSSTASHAEGAPVALTLESALPWIQQTALYLKQKAERAQDVNLYADWLIAELMQFAPDIPTPQYVAWISREDWFTVLQQFEQSVAPFSHWFTNLRAAVLSTLERVIAEDEQEQPPAAA